MTNLDSVLKSTDITDKDPYSQSYDFFPVVMYGCESKTTKKVEGRRIDAFDCGVGEDS